MWFKREKKNRRSGRRHVLEVKLRSDKVRAARLRTASAGFALIFGTLFGLYLFWRVGEWTLNKFIYENAEFAISQIDIRSNGAIPQDELRRWSGVRLGQNLVALDLASVRRNLEMAPAIQSVSVERVLPGTLRIRVVERQPIARVDVPRADGHDGIAISVFQLDQNGYVMQPLDPRLSVVPLNGINSQLPEISGLNIFELQPGRRVESPQAIAALQLIADFAHSPMAGLADLQRVDISSPQVVVVTTSRGSVVTFAMENLPQQLARWREIYDLGRQMNKSIATLDLAVANNVPVRWMEMVSAPGGSPENINPGSLRRKNV